MVSIILKIAKSFGKSGTCRPYQKPSTPTKNLLASNGMIKLMVKVGDRWSDFLWTKLKLLSNQSPNDGLPQICHSTGKALLFSSQRTDASFERTTQTTMSIIRADGCYWTSWRCLTPMTFYFLATTTSDCVQRGSTTTKWRSLQCISEDIQWEESERQSYCGSEVVYWTVSNSHPVSMLQSRRHSR